MDPNDFRQFGDRRDEVYLDDRDYYDWRAGGDIYRRADYRSFSAPIIWLLTADDIALLGYVYSIQTAEWAILSYGLVMIFFLYMYVCFASAVYVPELWPTHLRLRGSGFVNAVGRIVAVFTPYGVALLLTRYGSIRVFIVLGVMLVLCALILFCFGIETRKVSLEEISSLG